MLALLGWNPGTEQEIFSLEELVGQFSIERVVKAGSRFDPEKARWFNRQYLQKKTAQELARILVPSLYAKGIDTTLARVVAVCEEIKERCDFVSDFWEQGHYFFRAPSAYDEKAVAKRWKPETPAEMTAIAALFETIETWEAPFIKEQFSTFMNEKGWNFGNVMNALRIGLVGGNMGPDLFRICEILGKAETLSRIKTAVEKLGPAV
jgi:glutamyl-tRNA synthetase